MQISYRWVLPGAGACHWNVLGLFLYSLYLLSIFTAEKNVVLSVGVG
jgi:hypothetical protein